MFDAMNNRLEETEEQINDPEDKVIENNKAKQKRGKKNYGKLSRLIELTDSIKYSNIHIIEVPETEERKREAENLFEGTIAGNFLNLQKETDIWIQEAQKNLNKINKSKSTSHIVIKLAKWSDKARMEWHDIFKVMNGTFILK